PPSYVFSLSLHDALPILKILDFARFFAGPYGTFQFALQGADVLKVEPIEGEEIRRAQLDQTWVERDMAPAFASVNANKRSIALEDRKSTRLNSSHVSRCD